MATKTKIEQELADARDDRRRMEAKIDQLAALLAQEIVETPSGKKLRSQRPNPSNAETAKRAWVGKSAKAHGWKFKDWKAAFGLTIYADLTPAQKRRADAGPPAP